MRKKSRYRPLELRIDPIKLMQKHHEPFASRVEQCQQMRNKNWLALEKLRSGVLTADSIGTVVGAANMIVALIGRHRVGLDYLDELAAFHAVAKELLSRLLKMEPSVTDEELRILDAGLNCHHATFEQASVMQMVDTLKFVTEFTSITNLLELEVQGTGQIASKV